jgi:hypothetical protein
VDWATRSQPGPAATAQKHKIAIIGVPLMGSNPVVPRRRQFGDTVVVPDAEPGAPGKRGDGDYPARGGGIAVGGDESDPVD